MKTVKQLLGAKGYDIWSMSRDAPVYEALKFMANKNIGSLLVLEAGNLIGLISERDFARQVVSTSSLSLDTPVREVMTTRVVYVRPEQTIDDCMALMTEKRTRHLPVLADERVIGLISIGDVVKAIISEQKFLIEQLENYIVGK